jgi:hypothetical protein
MINEPKAEQNQHKAKKERNGTTSVGRLSKAETNPDSEAKKSEKQGKYPKYVVRFLKATWKRGHSVFAFLDAHNGTVGALATVTIAVLTCFYVHYSRAQWKAMSDQLPELRTSADAAASAATTAKDTLRMGYRPWINAEYAELTQPLVFPPKQRFYLKLNFMLKNTGTSVATDGVAIAEVSPNEISATLKRSDEVCSWLEESKIPVDKNMRPRATGFVLAPGNTLPFPVGMGSDEIPNQQVTDGQFFVFGCLIYRDQFEAWHHTKFCFHPSGRIIDPGKISFVICDTFQEAD